MHEKNNRHIPWNRYNFEKYRDIHFWSYRPALQCTWNNLYCTMNLGQANDAYEKTFQMLTKVALQLSKSQCFLEFNADSEFKIGLYVDSQCVRCRHLALVSETLLLLVYIYQSCTIRHLDCRFCICMPINPSGVVALSPVAEPSHHDGFF